VAEQVKIDDKYTYEYDNGRVRILRHGQDWLTDPQGAKAWIAAAGVIEELRTALDDAIGAAVAAYDGNAMIQQANADRDDALDALRDSSPG